ncbi:MAG: hypothetical protein KKH98_15105 [Spirochaetes bacterium]|nr:hypothetical protein [Spirochaetota bacterium]
MFIKKIYFYSLLSLSLILLCLLGIWGYHNFQTLNTDNNSVIKYYAEHILYISILCIIILSLSFISVRIKSRNIIKELDKIIELSKYGPLTVSTFLKKLGTLGHKIDQLFFELNSLNEKKSLKISSLSGLNDFLIDNIDLLLLVTNARGKITNCSKKILTKYKLEKSLIIDKFLNELFEKINLDGLIIEMEKNQKYISNKKQKVTFKTSPVEISSMLYPVFNLNRELSYIICIFESTDIIMELAKKSEQITVKKPQIHKQIFDFFTKWPKYLKSPLIKDKKNK